MLVPRSRAKMFTIVLLKNANYLLGHYSLYLTMLSTPRTPVFEPLSILCYHRASYSDFVGHMIDEIGLMFFTPSAELLGGV